MTPFEMLAQPGAARLSRSGRGFLEWATTHAMGSVAEAWTACPYPDQMLGFAIDVAPSRAALRRCARAAAVLVREYPRYPVRGRPTPRRALEHLREALTARGPRAVAAGAEFEPWVALATTLAHLPALATWLAPSDDERATPTDRERIDARNAVLGCVEPYERLAPWRSPAVRGPSAAPEVHHAQIVRDAVEVPNRLDAEGFVRALPTASAGHTEQSAGMTAAHEAGAVRDARATGAAAETSWERESDPARVLERAAAQCRDLHACAALLPRVVDGIVALDLPAADEDVWRSFERLAARLASGGDAPSDNALRAEALAASRIVGVVAMAWSAALSTSPAPGHDDPGVDVPRFEMLLGVLGLGVNLCLAARGARDAGASPADVLRGAIRLVDLAPVSAPA